MGQMAFLVGNTNKPTTCVFELWQEFGAEVGKLQYTDPVVELPQVKYYSSKSKSPALYFYLSKSTKELNFKFT